MTETSKHSGTIDFFCLCIFDVRYYPEIGRDALNNYIATKKVHTKDNQINIKNNKIPTYLHIEMIRFDSH